MTVFFIRMTYILVPVFLWVHAFIPMQPDQKKPLSHLPSDIHLLEEMKVDKLQFDESSINTLFKKPDHVLLHVPVVSQFPELPRGCEVTSLAMLLNRAGIKVSKMTLASQIKKSPATFQNVDHVIHFGDPNNGFVGSMTNLDKPGLGVYHAPITALARKYLGSRAIDLTGQPFDAVVNQLLNGEPVWVITNDTYHKLPKSDFENWQTPKGKVSITYQEHAVLVTGFNSTSIYFNDPLDGVQNKKVNRQAFIESWEQMGSQAVSYSSND